VIQGSDPAMTRAHHRASAYSPSGRMVIETGLFKVLRRAARLKSSHLLVAGEDPLHCRVAGMKRTLPGSRILAAAVVFALPSGLLAQKAVFVVRHAEKASDANEGSVPLSSAGTARAQKLAAILKDAGVTAIYSTDTVRTKTTAEPLAAARKLSISTYDFATVDGKPDLSPLAEKLRREHSQDVVLVVGHSNTIAPLLSALGCQESVSIASDEYDNLFLVVPRSSGTPLLVRLRF